MILALDTNVLLFYVNRDCPEHSRVTRFIHRHAAAGNRLAVPWRVLYEFLRLITHPSVVQRPMTAAQGHVVISRLLMRPEIALLGPTDMHAQYLESTIKELPDLAGNLFYDVEIAVALREHGIQDIATLDRDFYRFEFLRVVNPFG